MFRLTSQRLISFFLALILASFAPAAFAAASTDNQPAKPEKLFMWKATSDTGEVYLLGSIHLVRENFYPLPAEITDAFQKSKALVVEIDPTKRSPSDTARLTATQGMYTDGTTIDQHLSEETRDAFGQYLQKGGIPISRFAAMKPWLVALGITVGEFMKNGYDPNIGVDRYFITRAHGQGKPVIELESPEFQLKLFSSLSPELQDKLLLSTLIEVKDLKTFATDLLSAWKKGDSVKLNELVTHGLDDQPEWIPFYKKIAWDRNITMTRDIENFLKQPGPIFVVVGSLHYVGDKGIIRLLKDKGYKVKQLARERTPEKGVVKAGGSVDSATINDTSVDSTPIHGPKDKAVGAETEQSIEAEVAP